MARDEGVTPVMANVLMVAVLVAVSIGIYILLAEFEDVAVRSDRRQGSFSVDMGPGKEAFHLLYVSGEEIPLADGFLQVIVDGTLHEHPLTDVAPQTADGVHWSVGERLCIVGPGTCLHPDASDVEVWVYVGEDVMFRAERDLAS